MLIVVGIPALCICSGVALIGFSQTVLSPEWRAELGESLDKLNQENAEKAAVASIPQVVAAKCREVGFADLTMLTEPNRTDNGNYELMVKADRTTKPGLRDGPLCIFTAVVRYSPQTSPQWTVLRLHDDQGSKREFYRDPSYVEPAK